MATIESPSDRLLYALLAVQHEFASPADVAKAAARCEQEPGRSLAELLIEAAALTPAQREILDREAAGRAMPPPVSASRATVEEAGSGRRRARKQAEAATASAPSPQEPGADLPAEHGGRYLIKGIHGRGGQARVLLAYDGHMEREVALKVLRTSGPGEGSTHPTDPSKRSTPGATRFLREARVTGQLEHPNIVPVHEVGRRADGSLYYSMRFVRGKTLAQSLEECRTLQDRLKRLGSFWDLCKAIAYAHSRGVVHRDIKPENVMVGEFGETVLIDWGVAKVKGEKDIRARDLQREYERLQKASSRETEAGTAVGTPSYMSPEQAKGQVDQIDDRSDVWGLGAVLFELLTGKPPFDGPTPLDTLQALVSDPLPSIRAIVPDAPRELVAIAEKCLRKDKADRYQSAKEVADEIAAFMTGGRVSAYEYSSWELVRRFAAKNKAAVLAAFVLLVVIILSLVAVNASLKNETLARERETTARKREEAARAKEDQERLIANLRLAQAYAEKADRMADEKRHLSAAVYAAASLRHNPAHPRSPFASERFASGELGAAEARVSAASQIYLSRFGSLLELEAVYPAEDALEQIAYSPDGKLLAAAEGNDLRLIDLAAGSSRYLKGHAERVYSVAFSPDGARVATGARDHRAIVWDVATGKPAFELTGHQNTVSSVAFSADGRLIATGSWDKSARLWDAATGAPVRALAAHPERVTRIAFSPDGALLASSSDDKTVRLWDASSGAALRTLSGHTEGVLGVAFSPDGRRLVSSSADRRLIVWDAATGAQLSALEGHRDGVTRVAFSPDGQFVASVAYDNSLRLWDARRGQALLSVDAHEAYAIGLAFSPDGRSLATSGFDKAVKIWRLQPERRRAVLEGHTAAVYPVVFSPDGKRLASAGWDKTVRVWDFEARAQSGVLTGSLEAVDGGLAFHPSGTLLASAGREPLVRLWDLASGTLRRELSGHEGQVYGVAFDSGGRLLASAGLDKTVRLWDVESGEELRRLEGHTGIVDRVVFSPDGKLLASGSYDHTVRLWDPSTGKALRILAGHTDWVSGLAFSPDGKRLASSGKDGVAILWDPATGAEVARLRGHAQWVNDVRYSPDGELLATGSDDKTARLWSAATGESLLILRARREVVGIDFSRDGKTLALADGNDVALYPLDLSPLTSDPEDLLRLSERRAGLALEGIGLRSRAPTPEPAPGQ